MTEILSITFNKREIQNNLDKLREYHYYRASDLPEDQSRVFKQILHYISTLYNTPHYILIHDMVQNTLESIKDIRPGTVGSHLLGCIHNEDDSPNNDIKHDSRKIIAAVYKSGFYHFKEISGKGPHNKTTLLYIDGGVFPGFTEIERRKLKIIGCEPFYLIGYKDGQYIKIYPRKVCLEDIPCRFKNYAYHTFGRGQLIAALLLIVFFTAILIWIFFPQLHYLCYWEDSC